MKGLGGWVAKLQELESQSLLQMLIFLLCLNCGANSYNFSGKKIYEEK